MEQAHANPRRKLQAKPAGEHLEPRSLLTGGAGNIFALVSNTIEAPGGAAAHTFTIDPANFKIAKRSMTLGIDVAPMSGSTIDAKSTSLRTGTTPPTTAAAARRGQVNLSRVSNNAAV